MKSILGATALAAIALAVAACGSSSSSSAAAGNSPAAAGSGAAVAASSPAAASGGAALATASVNGTQVLTNSKGFVLYWFVPDTATASKCSGSCATYWPPVTGTATAGSGITGTLSSITRSDGTKQVTYDGHPLYTFSGDTKAGEAKGNDVNASGGLWWEMTVSGATPAAVAPKAAVSAKSSAKGGYGY